MNHRQDKRLGSEKHPDKQRPRIRLLLLAVGAIHVPCLFAPLFIDDYVYIAAAKDLEWSGLPEVFTSSTMDESASSVWWVPAGKLPFYRPIGELTFAVDYVLWGIQAFGYHLTNLLLHLLCTYLVWRLGRYAFESDSARRIAAAAFAIHPVHTEAVAWISGRFDLLVCAAVLGSTLCYLRWRLVDPARQRWCVAALCLFVVALGCKETALVLPAVLLAIEIFLPRPHFGKRRLNKLVLPVVGFGVIASAYLAGRFALFGGLGDLPPPYGIDRSSLGAALSGAAWNLALYALDFALCIPADAFYIAAFWQRHAVLTAVALAVTLLLFLLAWRYAGNRRPFRIGLLWLALFTAPSLLAMPGERNAYLATVGLALMIGALFAAFAEREHSAQSARWRWKRFATALVGIGVLLCVAQQVVMWGLAAAGEKVYRDVEAHIVDPPPGLHVYVIHQSPFNSVGFAQALRLRYDRDDIVAGALTISPRLNPTCRDVVEQTSADTIRIVRHGRPIFESFIERFHLFGGPVSGLAKSAGRLDLELLAPPDSLSDVRALRFRLPFPIDDPRLRIFIWDNCTIKSHLDFGNTIWTAGLVPWPVNQNSPA